MSALLSEQESLVLSPYTALYDLIVPEDNMLRQLNELVDFSFIIDELKEKYCLNNGRTAISPIRMFKYLLLKAIYDISDVDVVERSKYDMSFKYFLNYAPEDDVIDSSSLTKFRRLRLKDIKLLDMLINKTVEIAMEHGLIESKTIMVDATHTASRYCAKTAVAYLQEKSKQLRKAVYQFDESVKELLPEKPTTNDSKDELAYSKSLIKIIKEKKELTTLPAINERINMLEEVMEDYHEQSTFSEDPDARTGYKSQDYSFHGYKTHLAMSDERIITAAVITSGDKGDGSYLKELVEKSKNAGMEIDTVLGDTAYSGTDNLNYAKNNFNLISKLHPIITNGTRKKEDEFEYNKDAGMFVCPAGHLAKRKSLKKKNDRNDQIRYHFDVELCKVCPLRDGCYQEGAKSKTYCVTVKSTEHQEHEAYQETDEFKERAKERYKIEAKNSELKNRHGLNRAKTSGLFGMQIQGAATIFTVNMKRIMKLKKEKEENQA